MASGSGVLARRLLQNMSRQSQLSSCYLSQISLIQCASPYLRSLHVPEPLGHAVPPVRDYQDISLLTRSFRAAHLSQFLTPLSDRRSSRSHPT